jgi:hypothetical protein
VAACLLGGVEREVFH